MSNPTTIEDEPMTEISERYARLADAFAAKIVAVPDDAWTNPTPCDGWTARDLVGHVVQTQGMFLGFVGRGVGDVPSVDDDPAGAFAAARAAVQRDLEDPVLANAEFDGFAGRTTFEAGVDRFLCFDLVVHAWDLAHAVGLDETIHPDDVASVQLAAEAFGPTMRSPQAFGPAVEPPDGADAQARLLAFLGREP
jgi:uncharacterized protein (TIGR03086 family)